MKSAFALSLSQDGIALLHRKGPDWETVGTVNPEGEGLDAAMAALRDAADALEPEGYTTKLVLPGSQILFTEIDAPGPDRAARRTQIARALEGRTPYGVADLVFDWSGSGRMVKTAVVARVTLDEAESFAEHYGFRPVSFVADPDAADFAGEPWFGATAGIARHVPEGSQVTRDQDPIGLRRHLKAADVLEPVQEASTDAPVARVSRPDLVVVEATSEAPFIAVEDDASDAAGAAEPLATVAVDLTAEAATESAAAVGPDSVTAGRIAADAEDWLEAADAAAGKGKAADAPSFASRRLTTDAAPGPVAEAAMGDGPRLSARATRIDMVAPPAAHVPKLGGAHVTGMPDATTPEPGPRPAPPKRPELKPGRPVGTAKSSHAVLRRVLARATGSKAPKPVLRHPRKAPEAEAEELTVFGARRGTGAARRGTPRYLGLMLTLGLLVFMAAAVLWSMLFDATPDQMATTAAEEPAAVAAPEPAAAEASDTAALPASSDTAPELTVVEPDPDADLTPPADDPAAGDDTADAAAPAVDATAAAEPAAPATDPEAEAAAAAVAAAAAAPTATASTSDSAPTVPTPAAAPEAAPALWGVAPASATAPAIEDTSLVRSETRDVAKTGAATVLPDAATLQHDPVLPAQPAPVPFDQLLRYDAAGLIIPTVQGVVSPDGFTVFAGKPPVQSKPRPATLKPPPTATEILIAPQGATTVAPTPDAPPNPLLGKKPLPRPASLPTSLVVRQGQNAVTAPDAATVAQPVQPPPVAADPRLAAARPKGRPASIAAAVAAATEARTAIADAAAAAAGAEQVATPDTASATRYAVARSARPSQRPSRLSQGVEAALALAVATPAAEATAPQPEPVSQAEPAPAAQAEVDEPEPVQAAPSIPTRASVAKQATIANAMDLGRVNLIGVYGASGDRRAMVRMPTGRFVKVKVGDNLDGGRVAAISDTQLSYVKGGRTIVLKMIRDS